jgi:hypothetical protein
MCASWLCIMTVYFPARASAHEIDPSQEGSYDYRRVVYATPGVDYGDLARHPISIDPGNYMPSYDALYTYAEYHLFSDPEWETPSLEPQHFDLPETDAPLPMNGILYLPAGIGPFPLVLFVHGRHPADERSEPGYEYLCSFLATHGVMAATVDMNRFNRWESRSGRAFMTLEHVRQFEEWNVTVGHPLYERVDLENIILAGHSRGGEAVALASQINSYAKRGFVEFCEPGRGFCVTSDGGEGLGPWAFDFRGIIGIAPTERGRRMANPAAPDKAVPIIVEDDYFVIAGSRDSDLNAFEGQATYERAVPFDPTVPEESVSSTKGLLFVHGANHNFFNTVWSQVPDGSGRCFYSMCYRPNYQIPAALQQDILRIFVSTVVQGLAFGREPYVELLKSKEAFARIIPNEAYDAAPDLAFDFNMEYQGAQRLLINHYEEDTTLTTSSPLPFPVVAENRVEPPGDAASTSSRAMEIDEKQEHGNRLLDVQWRQPGGAYVIEFSQPLRPYAADGQMWQHLIFRAGLPVEDEPLNAMGNNQALSVELVDIEGNVAIVGTDELGDYDLLPYPEYMTPSEARYDEYEMVFQSVTMPFSRFRDQGVDLERIHQIILRFDKTESGRIYIDDIQFGL